MIMSAPSASESARAAGLMAALRRARIPVQAGVHNIGPQATVYHLAPPPELMARALGLGPALGAALNVPSVRLTQRGGWLAVEVPRQTRGLVLMRDHGPGLALTLAGELIRPRFDDRSPHLLIAGETGCGKTETLRSLVALEAMDRRRLLLIDLEGQTWRPLAGRGYAVVDSPAAATAALAAVVATMQGEPGADPILVAIDEAALLPPRAQELVREIAERGRKWRVHLAVATQHPRADVLDMRLKANLPTRIIGRCAAKAEQVVDMPGARLLRSRGDVLIAGPELPPTRAQVALADAWIWRRLPPAAELGLDLGTDEDSSLVAPSERYRKADDGPYLDWALGEWAQTRVVPSAKALMTRFKLHPRRAGRIRDAVLGVSISEGAEIPGNGRLLAFPQDGKVATHAG